MEKVNFFYEGVLSENACARSRSSMIMFDDSEVIEFEEELDVLLSEIENEEQIKH